jgi:CubicO group peptidase (beta-lactamase class C family)
MFRSISLLLLLVLLTLMPGHRLVRADLDRLLPAAYPDLAAIDAYVQTQMERSSVPGLAYAIVEDGRVVHLQAFGVAGPDGRAMTPQTPLYIGSVGKTFTALATRQLTNAGLLDLDAPVVDYLPWFTLADADAARQITTRHLLMHTSGFGNLAGNDPALYNANTTGEELVRRLATLRLNRPVGQTYEYSNINYIILGQVLEAAAAMPYDEYVQRHIFAPLEMNHSYLSEAAARQDGLSAGYRYYFGLPVAVDVPEPMGAMAAGFHISSAEDMAHYLIAFMEHGRYQDISVVNPDGQPRSDDRQIYYNINWIDLREASSSGNTEAHSGGWLNYSAGIAFMPYEGVGVVTLANAFPAQFWDVKDAYAITFDVLRLYTGNPPEPLKPRLTTLYMLGDAALLVALAFVGYRFTTLRHWRLNKGRKRPFTWLPSLLVDLLLPLFVLLVWPVMQVASPGNINLNPWWNWQRLAFSVPDMIPALFLLAAALLAIGLVKLVMWRNVWLT